MATNDEYSIVYDGPIDAAADSTRSSEKSMDDLYSDFSHKVHMALAGFNVGQVLRHSTMAVKSDPFNLFEYTDPVAEAMLGVATAKPGVLKTVPLTAPVMLFRRAADIGRAAPTAGGVGLGKAISGRLAQAVSDSIVSSEAGGAMIANPVKLTRGLSDALFTIPLGARSYGDETLAHATISSKSANALMASVVDSLSDRAASSPRDWAAQSLAGRFKTTFRHQAPRTLEITAPETVRDVFGSLDLTALKTPAAASYVKVFVWDLDANVEWLTFINRVLNGCQEVFRFYTLDAPVPAGLLSRPAKVLEWAAKKGRALPKNKASEIKSRTLIDTDFFRIGKAVRENVLPRPDLLVGVTPAWVAGHDENGQPYFDYFSSTSGKMVLVSTTDLREIAAAAGKTFEVAVALTMIAQILVSLNSGLEFHNHKPRQYCLFDEPDNAQFKTILISPVVEDRCLKLMKREHRAALVQMLAALRVYTRAQAEAIKEPAANEALPSAAEASRT